MLDLTARGDCETNSATLNLDLTGEQRKGKIEATFGIQKENRSTKFTTLKVA